MTTQAAPFEVQGTSKHAFAVSRGGGARVFDIDTLTLAARLSGRFYVNSVQPYSGTQVKVNGSRLGIPEVAGDPADAVNGDIWYNTSTSKLRGRQGAVNIDLGGGAGGAAHTIQEDGVPLTQRTNLNFRSGLLASDGGAGLDSTIVDADYATTEIADVAAAKGAGVSSKLPRADHVHAHGSGYLSDAHHLSFTSADHSAIGDASPHHAAAHNIFSAAHGDTTGAASPIDGDVIIGNVTPKWSKLAISIPAASVRNVLGIDNGELRPSWKTALDATVPTTIGVSDAAAAGTSLVFSHRDHQHGSPATFPATAHNILSATHGDTTPAAAVRGDVVTGQGVSPAWARLAISVPAASVRNVLGVDNGDTEPAWKTALDATNPANIAATASPGTSLVFAHRDHVHAHPDLGDLHTGYLLATGARAGSTSQAQSFGATGLKADVVAESTAAAGVMVGGVLLKDDYIEVDEIAAPGAPTANKLRLYAVDVSGVTALAVVDAAGVVNTLQASMPRGVRAQTSSTSLSAADAVGAEVDCLTLAAIAGDGVRRVRLTVFCWVNGSVAADIVELRIKEGVTTLQTARFRFAATGGSGQQGLVMLWEFVPTAASHTYKFVVIRTVGTGTVTALATAASPAFIMCEDIGI